MIDVNTLATAGASMMTSQPQSRNHVNQSHTQAVFRLNHHHIQCVQLLHVQA